MTSAKLLIVGGQDEVACLIVDGCCRGRQRRRVSNDDDSANVGGVGSEGPQRVIGAGNRSSQLQYRMTHLN